MVAPHLMAHERAPAVVTEALLVGLGRQAVVREMGVRQMTEGATHTRHTMPFSAIARRGPLQSFPTMTSEALMTA